MLLKLKILYKNFTLKLSEYYSYFAFGGTANSSRRLPDLPGDNLQELRTDPLLEKSSTNLSSIIRGGQLGSELTGCLPIK